jgi:hypothetical protein
MMTRRTCMIVIMIQTTFLFYAAILQPLVLQHWLCKFLDRTTRIPIYDTVVSHNVSHGDIKLSNESSLYLLHSTLNPHLCSHRLFHGNFVLDNEVPQKLLDMCALRNEREFTHMRYSAATCDPNDFKDSGFTLRQAHYDPPRRTELFIVMTMYNEDEELFCRTMHGVMKNVAHLCKRDRSKTWGKDGWKKVVVCIVSDGRAKINARTLSVIATMGAYQEGVAKVRTTPPSSIHYL